MSKLVAPLQASVKIEMSGAEFLEALKIQAAADTADRELIREGINMGGNALMAYLNLLNAKEVRRAKEAEEASLRHQVSLAKLNAPAKTEPRRKKTSTTTSHINGVYKDLD